MWSSDSVCHSLTFEDESDTLISAKKNPQTLSQQSEIIMPTKLWKVK